MTALEIIALLSEKGISLSVVDGQLKVSTPKGAFTDELRGLLVANKAEVIELLSATAAAVDSEPVTPADRSKPLPLSSVQQRLWFLNEFEPGSSLYNIPSALRLRGELDSTALQQAFDDLIARHESLRTRFVRADETPVQIVDAPAHRPVDVIEASGLNDNALAAKLTALCMEPFDLENGPLVRLQLLELGPDDHALQVVIHHIVADGWSMGILMGELAALYNAHHTKQPLQLDDLPVQFADYAAWQQRQADSGAMQAELQHWHKALAGAPLVLDLPTDRPRPAAPGYAGAWHQHTIGGALREQLATLARQTNTTLYMLLLAAFDVLLARYSGSDDLLVGSPVAGRDRRELEGMIGALVNTVVMRAELNDDPTFRTFLERTRVTVLDALEHQSLPFEKLVEELQPDRNLSHAPVCQVVFNMQSRADEAVDFAGLSCASLIAETGTAKFDLHLLVEDRDDTLLLWFEYATELFDASTIAALARQYTVLLENIVADPDCRVDELPLIDAAERTTLLAQWQGGTAEYSRSECLHEWFERQAASRPDAPAVTCNGETLSYGELNARANRLAHYLGTLGIEPDTLIGLSMERSLDVVTGILGILKAGGAYLPLDPHYPADRLAFMLEDSATPYVVTHREAARRVPDSSAQPIVLEDLDPALPEHNPSVAVRPHNLAYCIYTSGSTGRPKGVLVEHAQVTRLMAATADWYDFAADDVWTLFHSYAFDFTVWELWGALLYGGRLVVVPYYVSRSTEEFYELLVNERVTVLNQTPSAFAALLRTDAAAGKSLDLRYVIFGGEALDLRALKPWFDRHGDTRPQLINMYGITETTVHVTYRPLTAADCDAPGSTIGTPIPDLQIYVLDEALNPLPAGVPGEMYVGGAGLARGYLNRAELTAQRFVANPFSNEPGARLYRTGDLARYRRDGDLEYLGRADDQVKLRGFRIELGEIDAAVCAAAGVDTCATLLVTTGGGDERLISYVVTDATELDSEGIRATVGRQLPDYMVPAAIVAISALPLTPNGKLDRTALPQPQWESAAYIAPETEIEKRVCGLYENLLDNPQIGLGDDFFAAGGHSLLATRLISRIRNEFGYTLALKDFFQDATAGALAGRLTEHATADAAADSIPVQPRDKGLPLSFAQQRLWFLHKLLPDSSLYNVPWAMRLKGELDIPALQTALDQLVERHESLRTAFVERDDEPLQLIRPHARIPLQFADVSGNDAAANRHLLTQLARETFVLKTAPLLRVHLLGTGHNEHILLFVFHHIIADAWSLGLLFDELMACYEGHDAAALPRLTVQYADYAVWQRQQFAGDALRGQVDFWRTTLNGAPALLELPTDRPRPAVPTYAGGTVTTALPQALAAELSRLSQEQGVTLYMTLFAAFFAMLSRYSGQDDVVVGTPVSGRSRSELEGVAGFFLNTLPVRMHLDDKPGFLALLERVRNTVLDAQANQDVPFERLVEELQPARDMSHTPFFQVMFTTQNLSGDRRVRGGLTASNVDIEYETAKYDLSWSVLETADELVVHCEFATDLFDHATARRMLGHYRALLTDICASPQTRVSELNLLGSDERNRLLAWNLTAADYPAECLHHLFEMQAAALPDAIAVASAGKQLSYRELNERANDVAERLITLGAGPGERVAICVNRSCDALVGLLGILKSGSGYVPLDPIYPAERIAYMLQDSGAAVLVTENALLDDLPHHAAQLLNLDDCGANRANPRVTVTPDDLAYLIYTSGSTGKPKGVEIQHRAVVNFLGSMASTPGISADDRMLAVTTLCFDISILELFLPLLNGATVVLATQEQAADGYALRSLLDDQRISLMQATPATWRMLLDAGWRGTPGLRALVGGEALPRELALALHDHAAVVWNMYGPTETTIWSTCHRFDPADTCISVGRPIANTQCHVLDDNLQPVPVGIPGQLWIGGAGVARGYWRRPELTAERFIANPFGDGRLYFTGDRVRWLADGTLEVLGRTDYQVKLRGFRIELGEIEAALSAHPAITQSVVVLREDTPGDQRLVAYNRCTGTTPPAEALREFLGGNLPDYMVPSAFVTLEAYPLTPNGKVDRNRLPAPGQGDMATTEFVAPRNATETRLCEIWAGILGADRIGVHDDFFAIGGHSLLAVRLLSAVRDEFARELSLLALFEHPTVAAMAAQLGDGAAAEAVALPTADRSKPLPLSSAQQRLWFLAELEPDSAAYNMPWAMRLDGNLDIAALQTALDKLIARHESLRTTFPSHGGEPVQQIHMQLPVTIEHAVLRDADETMLLAHLAERAKQPFDLHNGPLLNAELIETDADGCVLAVNLHHIIYDAWSHGVLMGEWAELYAAEVDNRAAELPDMPAQFADYAAWEHDWERGPGYQEQLAYWRSELDGAPGALEFPTDFPRPTVQTNNGARFFRHLPDELLAQLNELAAANGCTLFMVLLAAWNVLLARYSGQDDIVVSIPISGRKGSELEGIIGFFLNTLAIRTRCEADTSFTDILGQVRRKSVAAYAHQEMPFGKLVDELDIERDTSRPPIAQMHFVLQHVDEPTDTFAGLRASKLNFDTGTTKFDMTLFAYEVSDTLAIDFEYNADLYLESTIAQLAEHFENLLSSVVSRPGDAINALPLLGAHERRQLLVDWNATARDYPQDVTLQTLVEAQVERTPDAVAIELAGEQLSYAEFNGRANQLAHALIARGVGPETLVGVCLERSFDLVIALHAIQKAGGAYVPLDPEYPQQRLAHMLEDADIALLVTTEALLDKLPPVDIDVLHPQAPDVQTAPTHNPAARAQAHNAAYVIFTSGSTGRPKGVLNEHRGISNRLLWMQEEYGLDSSDSVLQKTPFSFDVSVWEFFWPLMTGASLVIAKPGGHKDPVYLANTIRDSGITTLHFVPSMLQIFLQEPAAAECTGLRRVICSGEALPLDLTRRFGRILDAGLHNLYGPTEAAIDVTYWHCERDSTASFVPIGRPVANTAIYIVDARGAPVPVGVAGELWIGGIQVARGYVNRPELTAERFIADPFATERGDLRNAARVYRTGDLVRYRADGRIEFLGRLDHQVKLRGFRIELGEIETALLAHPAVDNAVVIAREDRADDPQLVAYLLADTGSVDADELGDWQDEQVGQWQTLWEETYSRDKDVADLAFDITGWDSSYTGDAIPAAEMREWVESTCGRILDLEPRRVLEIGSGSGLLAARIGPHVDSYLGTDFSAAAAETLNRLAAAQPELAHVKGLHKPADRIAELDAELHGERFDTIIINSVAQYFPNMAYLDQVIQDALGLLTDGGCIFLGDLRSLALLETHHQSVQLFRADDTASAAELQEAIRQNMRDEEELVIDPAYFLALREQDDRVRGVRFALKRGAYRNELSRFRYDAVITTAVTPSVEPVTEDWQNRTVPELVAAASGAPLLVRNVPDARLAEERCVAELLANNAAADVAALRAAMAGSPTDVAGIEPEDLFAQAAAAGVDVQLIGTQPGYMNALLQPAGGNAPADHLLLAAPAAQRLDLGNDPLHSRLQRKLVPLLRAELEDTLPDYMVPSAFVIMDSFPLTASGKIDRKALPAPERGRDDAQPYVAPRDGTEAALAEIWSGVLGIAQIGIHDNFFSLGGHSLLATQMVARVREQLHVRLPLVTVFNHPTIAGLAAQLDGAEQTSDADIIKPCDRSGDLPLSFSQQRLWFIDQMSPGNIAYNSPWPIRLEGKLDAAALQAALDDVVAHQEILRTSYQARGGRPRQVIDPDLRIQLQIEDMAGADEAALEQRISEISHQPFNLATGPLLRAYLLRYDDAAQVLVTMFHHISTDAWSNGVFLKELAQAYNARVQGKAPELKPLPVQYADYAAWQRDWIKGAQQQQQLDYWKRQLAGAPELLALPTDKPRPAVQTYAGAFETRLLSRELLDELQQLAHANRTTLLMVMLAAFNVLLSIQARQDDVVIGTPIAGRRHAGLEDLIGVFINMLPIRIDLSGKPSFTQLLEQVRRVTLEAYSNEDLPFEMLVEELQPNRDMSHAPIFQVIFDVQIPSRDRDLFAGLYQSAMESDLADAKVDLTLTALVLEEGLKVRLDYNTDLFEQATAQRMIGNLETLLHGIVATPDRPVNALPQLTGDERAHLLQSWQGDGVDFARPECLHQLFEQQAAARPDAPALKCDGVTLSYGELNARANRLAHALIARGVTADTLVGLSMERSLDLVAGILGIMKAGGAYLPLDPNYPADRLAFMLEDSEAAFVVTHRDAVDRVPPGETQRIVYEELGPDLPDTNPDIAVDPAQLAYVIYTSGSTGKPKGALIEHRHVTRLMAATEDWYGFNDRDVWTLFHSYAFDFTVWELWGALLYGGRLVVVPYFVSRSTDEFYELLVNERVTVLNQTPSAFAALMRVDEIARKDLSLRYVIFGGEALDLRALKPWFARHGDAQPVLVNMYGITETTVHVTYRPLVMADCDAPGSNIGVPIPDLQIYVLDELLQPVPQGVPGEMYVGGAGLARGYLKRPELTAERFIRNPFSDAPDARLYRTGDLARYRADGDLEYLGRADDQVKLRGFRIELGEIEAALLAHDSVNECVVVMWGDSADDKKLIGYAVAAPGAELQVAELRQGLKERLPDYMVPSAIIELDALPLTANGKIDRKSLPDPEWARADDQPFTAPRNPIEEVLLDLWREILGADNLGIHDDFFELGGHSLLATQLIARIADVLEIQADIRLLFEAGTVAEFAARIDEQAGAEPEQPIQPVARDDNLPLSFAQQRLWFLDQLDPENAVYNVPWAIGLSGPLQFAALQEALGCLVARHETLRTTFPSADGNPVQLIAAPSRVPVDRIDMQAADNEALQLKLAELAQQPFDLGTGPLFRAHLLQTAADEHILVLVMHHIISDGWSLNVMFRELVIAYEAATAGQDAVLPPMPIQYADYAAWQREWLSGAELDRQLDYWRSQLAGAPARLELPTDRPRPAVQSFAGAYVSRMLSEDLHTGLRALARENGCTLFIVLLAVFDVLLARYSGQDDIVIGTPIAGRKRTELESLVGFFINTLVLRTDTSDAPTFAELLKRVRKTSLEAYAHQDIPFEKLVDELQPARDMSHTPLFQVMFILQNAPWTAETFSELQARPVDLEFGTAKFDLTLSMAETPDGLNAYFEYNVDLYDRETVERMLDHFEVIARAVTTDPALPLAALPLLTDAEQQQQRAWNATAVDYDRSATFPAIFSAIATDRGNAPAILFADRAISYAQLDADSNRLANLLVSKGIGKGDIVALSVERSPDIVTGILGIMKAGAAYVPVDPDYPQDRIAYMLADSGARLVLTQAALRDRLPVQDAPVVCFDSDADAMRACPATPPAVALQPTDLAYIIYTSGSTGRPKGVMIEHRGLANLMAAQRRAFGLGPDDRMLQFASISFDASIYEIVKGLGAGASLCIASKDETIPGEPLLHLLQTKAVTTVTLPPSALNQLPEAALPALRTITVAGEACPPELVARWAPGRRFFNLYGPTEFTVWATYKQCAPGEPVTIGKPVSNAQAWVLDANLQPLPIGVPGELCIGGASLARGYWNREALTAERFVQSPFSADPAERLYRTGDRVAFLPNGELEFLGRIDYQVKVRGFRIETGEIEATLKAHPQIRDCLVTAHGERLEDKQLIAYFIPEGAAPELGALRSHLQASLPEFMVPAAFVPLTEWPLTPNGKIDRKALPDPDGGRLTVGTEYVAATSRNEEILVDIWSELLNAERIGIHDNFFELGGDSILSIQIIARANRRGLHLTPKQLFQNQTIAELAAAVSAVAGTMDAEQGLVTGLAPLTPIQCWFLGRDLARPEHFNQSLRVASDAALDAAVLAQALTLLTEQHDALRLRFANDGSSWQQYVAASEAHELLVTADTGDNAALDAVQAGLDLHDGPLLRVALAPDRREFVIVVHHLAVDWLSWPVLLTDLEYAYKQLAHGKPVAFPRKTTAFKAWAERLQAYAASAELQAERGYWQTLPWDKVAPLPLDHPDGNNTEAHNTLHTLTLDEAATSGILQGLAHRYRVSPRDVLLTAVTRAVNKLTGSDTALIDLEGHGREDLFEDADLSRTVGWFTTLFPAVLHLPAHTQAADALAAVRDQLAALPANGIGYGVLRWLAGDSALGAQPQADIAFNYLGNIDQVVDSNAMFRTLNTPRGNEHSLQNERSHKLDINCMISGGRLYLNFGFSNAVLEASSVAALADSVREELQALTGIGDSGAALRRTPAAFPLAGISQTDLDTLLAGGAEIDDIYPLTPLQQGMLFHSLLDRVSDVYFASFNWLLEGPLDVARFNEAWNLVINQHTSLRTSTRWEGLARPMQLVHRRVEMPFTVEDWRDLSPAGQDSHLEEWLKADRNKRFDLAKPPLTRVTLIRLGDERYRMVWSFHHMIMDGWSVPLVIREVFAAYEALVQGMTPKLVATRPFSDYIEWLQAQDQTAAEDYWRSNLAGFTAPTPLPGARAVDAVQGLRPDYQEVHFGLPAAAGQKLKQFAQQHHLTLNTVTQGAWALLLSRYSGEDDILFGATTAGRPATLDGIESMIGLFLNTLPVRVGVTDDDRLLDWLQRIQEQQLSIQQHEYAALVDIQGWSDVPRGQPLFETLLAFENYPDIETMGQAEGSLTIRESKGFDRTNFPLTLNVAMMDTLYLRFIYDANIFSKAGMRRLGAHLETLLANMPEHAGATLAEMPMLTGAEAQQLDAWNDTARAYPQDATLASLLSAQATATPDAPALSYDGERLTYAEVEERSNRLAHYLRLQGIGSEARVGICMERSLDLVISILAVIKAGGAYVPMDPDYPQHRLEHMAEDAELALLLTQTALDEQLPQLPVTTVRVETIAAEVVTLPVNPPAVDIRPDHLAYIIFTSGSTGRPKGVMNEHRGIVNRLLWMQDEYRLDATDRVLQKTPFSFDVSVWEFFWPLISGAELVIAAPGGHRDSSYLAELIRERQITTLHFVPSMLQVFLQDHAAPGCDSVRRIICSGEALPYDLQRRCFERLPETELHNLYGPTEAAIDVTHWACQRDSRERSVPIGRPVANTRLYIVDRAGNRNAPGVPGELWISGVQVARGYVNRPELTAERFVADPFRPGERVYRTGDLARYRDDGAIEFLGRIDHQVKLRGFRIELGEIEALLDEQAEVSQSVVLLREDVPGLQQLVAYARCTRPAAFDEVAVREALAAELPDYMLPAAYVVLPDFPVTPNGKVDRKALPAPEIRHAEAAFQAPRNELEGALATLWAELLGVEKISVYDDFFALGGHSLVAMRLVSRIHEELEVQLPLDAVFRAPTLESLAAATTKARQGGGEASIVPLDRSSRRKRRR